MRKVIIFLFALSLFSCRPSSNLPASESSASDSVELKKQEAWESAHRLDSVEALLAEEGNEHDAEASALGSGSASAKNCQVVSAVIVRWLTA